MGRVVATVTGVLVLALLAAGLTEATLAIGSRGRTSDEGQVKPAPQHTVASPRVSVSPVPSTTPTVTPSPSVSPAASSGPSATTNSFVHMRADKSLNSAILYNLDGGTVVKLLPYSDAQWQEVQYNGTTGYIWRTYLAY